MVVFDIDGVLTDGRIYIDHMGKEVKSVSIREIDAIHAIHRRGYLIAAITGEDSPITEYFKLRFPWSYFISGCKNKLEKLKELEREEKLSYKEIAYFGDGRYDIEALSYAGIGICPCDGSYEAKAAADIVLNGRGGYDCVQELERVLLRD